MPPPPAKKSRKVRLSFFPSLPLYLSLSFSLSRDCAFLLSALSLCQRLLNRVLSLFLCVCVSLSLARRLPSLLTVGVSLLRCRLSSPFPSYGSSARLTSSCVLSPTAHCCRSGMTEEKK